VDPRVVVKEERVADITEDVICNNTTTSFKATNIIKASAADKAAAEVTEAKVVVIKEAKVAIINETLATLSAKLSVNNKLSQQLSSLCGLCVCL